ncbi:ribonuclease H1 domain-containing protein [Vibrio sp. PNB22_8_1]|uniref:ribonuclease H1 domain-containing protein n=1 Tax=unclassified Vibrio TaxID=2614977 RepID=UPI00406A66C7
MAKQKLYVVFEGRKTGIFNSWDETRTYVDGYKGAKHCSYKTRQEAQEALDEYLAASVLNDEELLDMSGDEVGSELLMFLEEGDECPF